MQDASKPIWFKKEETKPRTDSFNFNNVKLLVATPVHSEVSIHYTESLLTLQGMGHSLGLTIDFLLLKSNSHKTFDDYYYFGILLIFQQIEMAILCADDQVGNAVSVPVNNCRTG